MVAEDAKDHGRRALLNLGHTFGHALEAECGYSDSLYHGEAVAIGTVMAFDLSVKMGICPRADADRVRQHFNQLSLPTRPANINHPVSQVKMTADRLLDHTRQDKKLSDGKVTFVVTRGIGQAFLSNAINPDDVREIFHLALE